MPSRPTKAKSSNTKASRTTAQTTNLKPGPKLHSIGTEAQTIRVQGHVGAAVRRQQAKRDSR